MPDTSFLASLSSIERERICHYILPQLRGGRSHDGNVLIHSPLREDDHTPSFSVSLAKGLCMDFGSGEGLDIVSLAARLWQCDAAETIRRLRTVLGGARTVGQNSAFSPMDQGEGVPFLGDVALRRHSAPNGADQSLFDVKRRHSTSFDAKWRRSPDLDMTAKSDHEMAAQTSVIMEAEFWTVRQAAAFSRARIFLQGAPDHPIVSSASSYDGLRHATLCEFGCGLESHQRQTWLAFPYPTGVQLYRRESPTGVTEEGTSIKVNRHGKSVSGASSRPGASFFGIDRTTGQATVVVAKSPREAMRLWQHARDRQIHGIDVIGLATGEKARVSPEQALLLRSLVSRGARRFVVVLDHDTESAREVAMGLAVAVHRATGTEVAEIDVTTLTDGACKDVTEALRDDAFAASLNMQGTTLLALVDAPVSESPDRAKVFALNNPMTTMPVDLTFVLKGIAARGKVTVLGGAPGVGKSLFVQFLLQRRGQQAVVPAIPGIALYLVGMDTGEDEVVRRAHKIGGNGLRTIQLLDDVEYAPFMSEPGFVHDLVDMLRAENADTLVIDTLADVHGVDLNDAAFANRTMAAMRQVAERANAAVIVITHTRKSGQGKMQLAISDIADSRVFASKADIVVGLMGEILPSGVSVFEVQTLKSRLGQGSPPLRLEVQDAKGRIDLVASSALFAYEREAEVKQEGRQAKIDEVRRLDERGFTQRQIADKLGISVGSVNKTLSQTRQTAVSDASGKVF